MSGLFGQILGNMMGGQQAGQPAAIAGILQQLLASNGGVAGVVSRFEAAGLGGNAQSWVSTGENQPISADHIGQVFPSEQINAWATQAGTTPDKLSAVLAEALPHAVDHLTPGGQVPAPDAVPDLSSLVSRFFGGATTRLTDSGDAGVRSGCRAGNWNVLGALRKELPMRNWARSVFVAAGVLFAMGLQAHGQTSSPAAPSVAATCKDGTPFSGSSKSGACRGHGGVKTWGAQTAAATPAAGTNAAASPSKNTMPVTAKPGGGAGQVWVNTESKVYHCSGTRWYGKTKQGEYMSEQAAKTNGYHAAQGKTCS